MSVFNAQSLISQLENEVQQTVANVQELLKLENAMLNKQPAFGKWSIAQIIEHLNSYNRYYLPEIKTALQKGLDEHIAYQEQYSSGWFGDYFTKMMQPKEGGKIANKMNAPKDHQPVAELDARKVLNEFIARQTDLLQYLQQAHQTSMAKLRVPISISKFIKLKLGDTFRFLIAHQQRHFVQVNNTLQVIAPQTVA
ncbi:MAG: DinB family protein [Sphingobacteriales bacterium]|nr:MAG: DinB family protein [Sphingobacteriales bacterium]